MKKYNLLEELKNDRIKVVAVSKTVSEEVILDCYGTGHRDFGENRVQDLVNKYEALPKDIHWHMIGHLQKNKVKYIAPFVYMIQSVEHIELLDVIQKEAFKNGRTIDILLEVKIASEDTKYGLDKNSLYELIDHYKSGGYPNVRICGLMGMASFTDNEDIIHEEFNVLCDLFIDIKSVYFPFAFYFCELSMGMSSDFRIAMHHGSTMVRLGTVLFGDKAY